MTWGRFIFRMVTIAWNGPRNCSVRSIVIEFGEGGASSLIRVPETDLNTVPKYHSWAVSHSFFGAEVLDALWLFCRKEYQW